MSRPSKELIQHWYKKLAKSGFEDIEITTGPHEKLKQWHSHYFTPRSRRKSAATLQSKADYYLQCSQFLNIHQFRYKYEREIWTLHCEGETVSSICRKMQYKVRNRRKLVDRVLQTLHGEMKDWLAYERSY